MNRKKFVFGKGKIFTLDHIIRHIAIEPAHDKKEAIKQIVTSKSKKPVQQFLGLANYYR